MKAFRLTLLAALVLMGGCSLFQPQEPDLDRSKELAAASTEWRLMSLEESFLNFKETARERQRRFDKLEKNLQQRMEDFSRRIQDLQAEVAELEALRIPPVTVEERALTPGEQKGEVVVGGRVSSEDRPWADVPGPKAEEPEPAPKPKPKPKARSKPAGKAQYDKALSLLWDGKPDQARAGFNDFLEAHPKSALAPNAMYWMGETYYSQKDYAQAILSFKEVPQEHPEHPKAAAAVLKIAMSYEKLGDVNNAVFYLRALLDDYPDSEPAKIGEKRLAELAG